MKLNQIFDIKYGVNLELVNCEIDEENGIPFVARTSENNGVVAKVKKIEGILPNPAGTISCAAGGSVLSTFVQEEEYYSGRDLYVLTPLDRNMTIEEKLYYCTVISKNKYRYNYGRQANKTLKDLEIPDKIPEWVYNINIKKEKEKYKSTILKREIENILNSEVKFFLIKQYFNIVRGEITNLNEISKGSCPVVTAYGENQGVAFFLDVDEKYKNCLTASFNGSKTGYFSYHENGFNANSDCGILIPKFELNKYVGLFLATILNKISYKYMYGRKLTKERLENEEIPLPINKEKSPDWKKIEQYMKKLIYSDKI